jgi:ankyrin repeat protein
VVLGDGGPRHQATVRALVAAGADLDLGDRDGATPLALARQYGYGEISRLLEEAGARP